ncbi:MAG: histidine kinase, partial [Lachnospiraceae bacterium]|nr:histidine kinase [Lachnospiraceae bacterium]
MKEKEKSRKFNIFKRANIKQQLYAIYIIAIVLPITIIGSFLVVNTSRLLTSYHRDLLESDNLRVKTILFEITTQIYNISEELAFDDGLREMLSYSYYQRANFEKRASEITVLDNYSYNHAEIDGIEVYTDNPSFMEYKQFHKADEQIENSKWFQKGCSQSSVFWYPMVSEDKYGNEYWNLCLVRKIPLKNSSHNAVLVIRVSDNYLKTRINSQEYSAMISVDTEPIFFSSDRELYGSEQPVEIDYDEDYFQYVGTQKIGEKNCFVEMSTLRMYQSDSRIYIFTMNDQAYSSVRNVIWICLLIILLAILIPGMIIHYFTIYFTSRVLTLRQAMHQASNEDYEIVNSVSGQDELSEAFSDLEVMVQKIKQKDAEMYKSRIDEKELLTAQQAMEFKMLASQINPHFLYNTLETIRMKAFTVGDREVATAIKL